MLDHVGHILGRLFDIDRKGRREARLLAELQETLDAETVGRPAVPVSVVGRPLVAVADHLLEAIARNVDHRTSVTQEGQPLVDHRLSDVVTHRQAAESVFARGHQRHLIGLHPAGAVEVEGEAGQAAPMPVIRCEAYSFVPSALCNATTTSPDPRR